jgi:hypothetical protein
MLMLQAKEEKMKQRTWDVETWQRFARGSELHPAIAAERSTVPLKGLV